MRTSSSPGPLICCVVVAAFAGVLSVRIAGAPQHAPASSKTATPSSAAPRTSAPDFARDVLPIIENNCLRCHSAAVQKGGLVLDTHEDVMQGGENGTVLTPGDAAKSRLVQMIQAEIDPKMPPKSTLRPDEIAIVKAWIAAGAKDSPETPLARLEARIPAVAADAKARPAVHALAFSPDGRELAVPGYREVRRIAIGDSTRPPFSGAIDLVRSVAYSRDGAWMAGASGIPGAVGEVLLWNAETGALAHTLKGHRDYVYQVVFNQRGTRLATCSYDKTIRIWDVETGRPTHVFREHTEAVYAVAFSPDDRWLASGAGDRSVKIWSLASGARLYTLTEPTDVIQTLAFQPTAAAVSAPVAPATSAAPSSPSATSSSQAGRDAASRAGAKGDDESEEEEEEAEKRNARTAVIRPPFVLTAAGADKTIRTWTLTAQGGTQTQSIRGHNAPILRIAYSPDGKWLASSADDGSVKIWEAATGKELRVLEQQPDWAAALAWSPDGARLAVGRFDGTVGLYDAATGRRLSQLAMGNALPGPARKASTAVDVERTDSSATRRAARP